MPKKTPKKNHQEKHIEKVVHETKEVKQEDMEEVNQAPDTEIVEKIVYKKQRVHGFFRTLTILVVLVTGFLLLGESMGIAKVTIGSFALDTIYPLIVIFSIIVIRSYRDIFGKVFGLILFLGMFGGFFTIRTYNGLSDKSEIKFGEPMYFTLIDTQQNNLNISLLAGDIEMEGNTKSPYLQGTRTSDRKMLTGTIISGNQTTTTIKDDNTLNLLEDFVSHLTIYVPAKTKFNTIYIKNGRGSSTINTQDLHWNKLIINGGINKLNLQIPDADANAQVEIQGVIQDLTLTIPKTIGVKLQYRQRIGFKDMGELQYQTGYLYTSPNIEKAKKTITINVNVLLDKFHINRE